MLIFQDMKTKSEAALLDIQNLSIVAEEKEIVRALSLQIKEGEIHALMGPNGSGKSTLAASLMGHPKYKVTGGNVRFQGKDLFKMKPHERAASGLFLAFQYPKEIPGVTVLSFLRAAYNAIKKARQGNTFKPVPLYTFKKILTSKIESVGLDPSFLNRNVNENFSGGEKKKSEVLQMTALEPKLSILDETDSGLDIDALKTICAAIRKTKKPKQSVLMITHYPRMLHYLKPDRVHVMMEGRIVTTGGKKLAEELEEKGYDFVREKFQKSSSGLSLLK